MAFCLQLPIACLLGIGFLQQTTGQSCPTEYSYLSTLNKCVKVYGHAVKQSDAEYTCSLFGGGHLLSVHNSFQKQQILDFIAQQSSPIGDQYFWLGLTSDTNQYTWTDGGTFDYHSWAVGEPSETGKCTAMANGGPFSGDWAQKSCDQTWSFICETNATSVATTTMAPKKCPDKWTYFDHTNACYRVFRIHQADPGFCPIYKFDVGTASRGCSIHSLEENEFVHRLAADVDTYFAHEVDVYFGLHNNAGHWEWHDGSPVDYTNWATDNPSSSISTGYSAYFVVGSHGEWFDHTVRPWVNVVNACKLQLS